MLETTIKGYEPGAVIGGGMNFRYKQELLRAMLANQEITLEKC